MSSRDPHSGGVGDLLRVLVESAEAFLERGAIDDALRCSEQVLQLESDGTLRARALRVRGRLAALAEERDDADRYLRESIALSVAAGDHARAAESLNDLGESLRRRGDLAGARASLNESLEYSASRKPGALRARTLEELGTVFRLLGETSLSLDVLAEAKRIRETQADPAALARACRSLGNALNQAGRFEEALAEHTASLTIVEGLGDQTEIAMALNNVGGTQIQLGRNEDAELSLRRAHGMFESLSHPKMVAFVATNLGVLASYRGDTVEARSRLEEALGIQDREKTRTVQPATLNNLANVSIMAGDLEDAVRYADQSIALLSDLGRTQGLSAAWFARGRAYLELGRLGEAERAAERLAELARQSGNRESEADALLLSADIELSRDEPEQALATASRVRALADPAELPRHLAEAARLSGEARMRTGDEVQAREDLLQAERAFKELQSQYYLALSQLTLGRLFLRAHAYEAGASRLRAAAQASERMGHDGLHWKSLLALAEAEWEISRRLARQTLSQAAALAARQRRTDREEEVRALREDLSAGRGGALTGAPASQTVVVLSRILRGAGDGEEAIRGVLRGLYDLVELDAIAFLPSESLAVLGRGWPALTHPRDEEDTNTVGAGDSPGPSADSWVALRETAPHVVPVLGHHDLQWGTLVVSASSDVADPSSPTGATLQAAADLLGLALDTWAGNESSAPASGASDVDVASRRSATRPLESDTGIIGESARILAILDTVEKVAPSDSSVLILGESGTGKELIARELHVRSGRAQGPFEAIAAPSIPRDLIEAELFGHEKGAFTGADRQRPGRIELADGGTLFLDEIGDIDLATQSKLLRFLQEREFSRVGGREPIRVDVRIVAATSRNLELEIEEGRFREDLYYRLSVVPIRVPPLRERGDDILLIATRLLERLSGQAGKRLSFTPATLDALRRYSWPGNVRELRNLVEYLVAISTVGRLTPSLLPERIRESSSRRDAEAVSGGVLRPGETLDARLMTLEGELIRRALEAASGNQSEAARLLGVTESKLRHRLRRYGLEGPKKRGRKAPRRTS